MTAGRSYGCPSAMAGITSFLYDGVKGAVKNQITKGNWVVRGVDKVDDVEASNLVSGERNAIGQGPLLRSLLPDQF